MTSTTSRKPAITITKSDHARLTRLADALPASSVTDELIVELERARVVTDAHATSIVRLGSTLSYSTDAGEHRTVTLVLPDEADIAMGRISILTPIGVALIGLSAGQSINWTARDGRRHLLTVDRIDAPAETGKVQAA